LTSGYEIVGSYYLRANNFGGGAQPNTFTAILYPGGPPQTTTMPVVRQRFAAARASFDRLDQ
jgi:hypothetical protein